MAENCDIKLEILLEILHNHLNQSQAQKTVTSEIFFLVKFFTWPHNYYNDNNLPTTGLRLPFLSNNTESCKNPILQCGYFIKLKVNWSLQEQKFDFKVRSFFSCYRKAISGYFFAKLQLILCIWFCVKLFHKYHSVTHSIILEEEVKFCPFLSR